MEQIGFCLGSLVVFLPDEKDFAEMSIGGLLKEMKSRPSPRRKGEKNKA
jgi:hypothetical protein